MSGWTRAAKVVVVVVVMVVVCGSGVNCIKPTTPTTTTPTTTTTTTITTSWDSSWGEQPKNISDLTTILWYAFSSNKINFTSEDFRELVLCTSGRKQCPPLHTRPPLTYLTHCNNNTTICTLLNSCGQSEQLNTYNSKNSLAVNDLRELFPSLLYQLNNDHSCHNTNPQDPMDNYNNKNNRPRPSEVWGYGIVFVTVISGCSLVGVSVLPLMAHHLYQRILTLLVGLAVGSLAASSLFHLIPQAFKLAEKSSAGHHEYLFISLTVLLGIWVFFMIERIIKIIVTHQASKDKKKKLPVCASEQAMLYESCLPTPDITSENGHFNLSEGLPGGKGGSEEGGYCGGGALHPHNPHNPPHNPLNAVKNGNSCVQNDVDQIYQSQQQVIKASFGHSERPELVNGHGHIEFRQGQDSVIHTVAWMIIFGDGFHNFIDGVSIGAAFSESILTGISISLAVMCEELPHELGDFAVLLNAGMTMRQAVAYNFLSATTCYLGLCLGIALGEFTHNTTAIFALAAGMFLYIALVDMVPEMNEVASQAAEKGWGNAVKILMLQNAGIFIGIASLFCLAYFQDIMVLT